MNESPMSRIPSHGCRCFVGITANDDCTCSPTERGLRTVMANLEPLDEEQRQWCVDEIRRVEGWNLYVPDPDDSQLARDVLNAWTDFCQDKGLL